VLVSQDEVRGGHKIAGTETFYGTFYGREAFYGREDEKKKADDGLQRQPETVSS
jgi:hypothetical protein